MFFQGVVLSVESENKPIIPDLDNASAGNERIKGSGLLLEPFVLSSVEQKQKH